ncbi:hypothetical protein EMCRGX_G019242 [Ephydatia muelleri]
MVPSLVPVVTTSSYGNSIAGSVYTLVCMVKVVDGLVVVPDVVWMKDGGVLVNGTNIILTRTVSGGNSTLNLTFNPLLTSHGGQYTCVATISVPQLSLNITNSSAVTVSVQTLPPPVVTTSSYGSTIAGSVYSLVCMVKVVDGLVVNPDVVWMKDGGVLVNGTNTTLTRTVLGGNSNLNLIFNPLLTSHGGQYICVATISVPQLSLSVTNSSAVTVSVQIPVPSVTLSPVPLGSSVYTGTSISMSCAFTVPSVVDSPVMLNTLWTGPQGPIYNGNRTMTTITQSMMLYNATLQINPSNTSDIGIYWCVGNISSNSSYIVTSSNATANASLTVQALPPPVVTTSSYGSTIAGSVYSLVCMVKVVDGLVVVLDVVWMKDEGVLVNGTNITLTRTVSGGNSTLNLTFNPLLTSHGGQYTCVATISVPQLSLSVTNSSAVTVSVQIPVPSVTLSPVPLGSSVYTGTSISMSCAFTVPSVVDSPVMLNTLWIGPQGPIYNGNRTMTIITQSMMVYIATLQINPSNTSDTGIYWCVGNISSNSSFIVTSSNASANTSLTVQALPPPVVTTSSYGRTIAGSVYSLVCMVKVVDGLVVVPDVVWMKDGRVLVNGTNTTLTRTVLRGNSNLNLTFNPLLTSHGGQYTCVATISVPQLSLNITNSSAVTVSVQIPLPSATIVFVSPGSLVVSGIPISIFCAFSIPSGVDSSVMVNTFWIRLNQTLNNGDRIKISTSQSMAAYNTTLQITPVNISDTGMYQCVGSISSNSSYVVGSSNASANISLSVQALPRPVVTTSSYGSSIAGSVYSLVCMVKVIDGLVVVPDVVWMKDGGVLMNGTNTTLTRTVSGGNSTLNLTFNPLLTSHGGQCTCVATISVPQLSLNITNSSAVTVSVQIPLPSATIVFVSPGSLVVSGIPISIFCAFSIPSVVDSSIMVKTFWIRLNQTLNNGDRIKISTSQSMAAYNTTLQINPVNISDTGMYQCEGSISSNSSYVVGSSNASANISLSVQALPPPVVTTSSYVSSIAGSVYSLVCTVKVVDGLVVVPDVVWMKDGRVLVNGTNTTLTRTVSGGNSTLNLTFNPLLTSHGGQYTCVATISVPQLSLSITNSSAVTVSVQIPVPSVTLSPVPLGSSVYTGTSISMSCAFTVPSVVDSPVMLNTLWIGPQGPIYNGNKTMTIITQSMMLYNATLQINPSNTSDIGIYWCVGNISSNSSYIVTSSNATANASLTVQALPPPVVTTSSYGSTIAGSVYSLVCMVKVVDGLVVVLDVVWMKDEGVLVNGTNITLTRTVSGGNSTLNLTLNPLLTSHGGQYTCVATISVPQLSLSVTNSSAVTVSVQIPVPSVTVPLGSSVYTGTFISMSCAFTVLSVVDYPVMLNSLWTGPQGPIYNGNRTMTIITQSMMVYIATLQINPSNTSDTGIYWCVGNISSNSSFIVTSNNASANTSLTVQALPPPVVTTSSYGSTIAGSVYSLVCTVKVVDGLVVVPDVVWMKDGRVLVNGTNTTLTRTVLGGNSNLNLTFNPLLTSHGGQYTCVATISVPQLSLNVTNSSAVTVSVQIPLPSATIVSVSPGSLVVSGIPISIFCAFSIPSVVDTSVMVKTFWIRLNQTLNNGDRIKISTSQSMAAYNTTLQITPVNISDTGMYQCEGIISSNSSYVVGSSNASANISLSVQALPPPVVTTSSYGSTIAGLVYSLVCMVKVVDGLEVVPDVVWMKDGGVLVNGTNTTLTRTVSGGNSTLNLTFNPLLTSHGGQYTCVATISIPQLSLSITNSDVSVLSTQTLNVTITSDTHLQMNSINRSLICRVNVNNYLVLISLTWIKVNGLNSTIYSITAGNYSIYTFPYLSKDDSAQYICVANISLPYKDNYISSSAISEICLIAPDSVRGAKIDIVSDTNVFALWSSPWKTNGILRVYRVTCTVLEDYNKPQYVKYDSNLTTTSMNITRLAAGIPYELCISAHNSAGSGPEWCNVFFTDTLPPTEAPQGVVVTRSSDGLSMTVNWRPVTLMKARGFPFYAVSYTSNDAVRIRQAEQIIVYDAAFVSITELSPLADYSVSVTVLNHGNNCYCCCKLKPKRYEIYELNQPDRCVSRLKANMRSTDMAELDSIQQIGVDPDRRVSISLSCFRDHVEKMHGDENNGFQLEFKCLKSEPDKSDHIDNSQLPCNQVKNRFCNILPYDASRVKLKELNGIPGSDYINASYIDGYNCQNIYISTQGPTDETVNDFWRMVWEKRLGTIVMLTKCIENGREKCAQYWASTNGNHETAQFKVATISATQFADYTITSLVVSDKEKSEDEPLHVKHFHFTSWPDHGVPDTPSSLVSFIKYVQKNRKFTEESPLLVHCSAGVGRSGTFIALHILLERIKTEDSINVFECVNQMRKRRPFMVQSLDQYVYIHDAILEQIMCGDTEIDAGNFRVKVNSMYKVAAGNGTNGFVQQFQLLNDVCKKPPKEDCSVSLESCNEVKNRYKNKPHYNHTQIRLAQDSTNSTYINASRIQGYKLSCIYIATQGPLSNTVNDFWKMIMEQQCKTIVMLCELMEEGEESCACYWPTAEGPVNFGTISVHLLSAVISNGMIFRNFKLTENSNELLVAQYCYSEWPQHGKPASLPNMLTLLDTLNKALSASEKNVITVVCNDGCGRTGSFICIHSELERLKAEGIVNIFQSVKAMRSYRPGMVQDVGQYAFCHDVLASCVDGMSTYANAASCVDGMSTYANAASCVDGMSIMPIQPAVDGMSIYANTAQIVIEQ